VSNRGALKDFRAFSDAAAGKPDRRPSAPLVPEIKAPAVEISKIFKFQSYFDSTNLQNATQQQNPNEPIVFSTIDEKTIPGYAVGLHPSSQTPIAIELRVGAQQSSSHAYTLKPGQILRPHGLPKGSPFGGFSGIRWGLPFGWLGGGFAKLLVFSTPDADVLWPGDAEVIFQRQRIKIVGPASVPTLAVAGASNLNWPMRFPWPHEMSVQGANTLQQTGLPNLSITTPTKIEMRLRLNPLAAASAMRVLFFQTNDLDAKTGNTDLGTDVSFQDIVWPAFQNPGAAVGVGAAPFPVMEINSGPIVRIAADDGGIVLMDLTAGGTLTNKFVDVVRYGRF
jgi:hypothetical protein